MASCYREVNTAHFPVVHQSVSFAVGSVPISRQPIGAKWPTSGERRCSSLWALRFFYALLFLFIDGPVDLWLHDNCAGSWIERLGDIFSYLGDGSAIRLGLALSFILILAVDPGTKRTWTRTLLYVCLSCAIALVVGEGLKYLLARHRPVMLFEQNRYGLSFFSSEWAQNSSPSGHTLRAFAILTALSLRFRKGTAVFIPLGVLIGLSRVIVTDHYPSDVLFDAFIGVFAALWVHQYFYGEIAGGARRSHQGQE
jgi:membrane-associated phospholipid phosphatase